MSVHYVYKRDGGAKFMRPIHSREEYLSLRNGGEQIPLMKRIRAGEEQLKTELVQMNYSCLPDLSQEANLKCASDLLGVEFDKGAKDITRVFFTTTEAELIYLDDSIFEVKLGTDYADIHGLDNNPPDNPDEEKNKIRVNLCNPCQKEFPKDYHGIPFADIIKKYWEVNNRGFEPTQGDRDTLTYQLACDLRHICGRNFEWLDQVIPCYDGFPLEEKRAKIKSALASEFNGFPQRLRNTLNALEISQKGQIPADARSADAVNVHIDHLLWNVVMCGTPDALYRVVNNYTDGFQSRIAVARTPDNTFAPLEDKPYVLTDRQRERIQQIAHLLPLMYGEVVLPKLEAKGREWVERIRLETMKNDDRTRARQRIRVCVTAQRMTCCLMLCKVCEGLIQKHGLNGAETQLKQQPGLWKELLLKAQTPTMLEVYGKLSMQPIASHSLTVHRLMLIRKVKKKKVKVMLPRGIRNNNPLNIRRTAKDQWKGLRAQQTDASFCQFDSLEYGWRAAFYLLTRTYYHKYRLFTIRAIINRWAPPNENLTATYIQNVCRLTGIAPDEPIGIPSYQPARWMALGVAMAIQECGTDSLDYFAMLKGWTLARSEM